MKTYRIGVLADTHVPEQQPTLPVDVAAVFAGADLIFHLGDVCNIETLNDLSKIAPVVALRGEHDHLPLPSSTIVPIAGLRLGLIHARRPAGSEILGRLPHRDQTPPNLWWNDYLRAVVEAFSGVDAILFGGAHRPHMDRRDGVLLFSPGAIYHPTPDLVQAELAKNPPLLRRRELQRWLDEHGQEHDAEAAQPPTVGILAVSSAGIQAEVRSLSPTAS